MAVYVDNARHRFGRMRMSHMMADTHEELVEMADAIGVDRCHIQHEGTPREHFDICASKRALAIKEGAVEVVGRDMALLIRSKRR
jgi:hypothetical protein